MILNENNTKWIKVHCETNSFSSDINVENKLLDTKEVLNEFNDDFETIKEYKLNENESTYELNIVFTFSVENKVNIYSSEDFTLEDFNKINIEDFSNLHIRQNTRNKDGYESEIIVIFTKLAG